MIGVVIAALNPKVQKQTRVKHHFADYDEGGCEFVEGAFEDERFDDFHVAKAVAEFEAEGEHCQKIGCHRQVFGGLKKEIRHKDPQEQSRLN